MRATQEAHGGMRGSPRTYRVSTGSSTDPRRRRLTTGAAGIAGEGGTDAEGFEDIYHELERIRHGHTTYLLRTNSGVEGGSSLVMVAVDRGSALTATQRARAEAGKEPKTYLATRERDGKRPGKAVRGLPAVSKLLQRDQGVREPSVGRARQR